MCGSRILEGWVPPYDATVVARPPGQWGCRTPGKTNMDKFAMGSSTEQSAYGPTHNPVTSTGARVGPVAVPPLQWPPTRHRWQSGRTPVGRSGNQVR